MTTLSGAAPASLDVVAFQLAGADPERFYRHAAALDDEQQLLGAISERFEKVLRTVEEGLQRHGDGGEPLAATGTRAAQVLTVLRELQAHEPGSQLRRAGDSLARAQAEIRDLQLQRAQHQTEGFAPAGPNPYDEQALLVIDRVSADFIEVGSALLDLPTTTASRSTLAAGTAPPPPMLSLASYRGDDDVPGPAGRPPDLPSASVGLSGAVSPSAFDLAAPPSTPGGQPMMPMMPMGMGMGMGGQPTSRERRTDSQAIADPEAWREPNDGWEVLGRRPPPRPPQPQPDKVALDALEEFIQRRESLLGRGGRNV